MRTLDTPLVVSWHGGAPVARASLHRIRLGPRMTSGLVVLSERIAESMRRLGGPSARVVVIPGAVDTERFRPRERSEERARELGLGPTHRVLGVVARLQPHRRFDLLLEAFALAHRAAPDLRLLVVGRGTRARKVLEEPVHALGLEEAVVRAGYRRDDYREVLALVDALVFLVPGSDGSCRAVLETMSMEIPTIASRRGILPDTVDDGETGCLVDESAEALAEALLGVGQNPEAWVVRGKAARRRVLVRHTTGAQADRLERFYREVIGES